MLSGTLIDLNEPVGLPKRKRRIYLPDGIQWVVNSRLANSWGGRMRSKELAEHILFKMWGGDRTGWKPQRSKLFLAVEGLKCS